MKRIFISTDIEGVTGVTSWCETEYGGQGYDWACRQMSLETAAACKAVLRAGYQPVVKDGHGSALNIDPDLLPRGTELIRGWMVSPYGMMAGLDEIFSGVVYIGYHAKAGSNGSPLAHTVEEPNFNWIKVNGQIASEFSLNADLADQMGVPSLFISGDADICADAEKVYPGIEALPVKKCIGNATWNMTPEEAVEKIEEKVFRVCSSLPAARTLESEYTMEIYFRQHTDAKNAAWYPGAEKIDGHRVAYQAETPLELAVARMFMTGL